MDKETAEPYSYSGSFPEELVVRTKRTYYLHDHRDPEDGKVFDSL